MDLKTEIIDLLQDLPSDFVEGRHFYGNQFGEKIFMMCQESMTEVMMHYVSELAYYQQRVEELEMDLMLANESYHLSQREQANINPKRRTTF